MSVVGQGLAQIIVVLGVVGGVGGSRVVRGTVVATKENDFFLAANAVGAPTTQVLVRRGSGPSGDFRPSPLVARQRRDSRVRYVARYRNGPARAVDQSTGRER